MAAVLLALMSMLSLFSLTSAAGTVIALHKRPFFEGGEPLWVIPDPTKTSGCTNLPKAFTFESSRFFWNETGGVARCHFIWFYYGLDCQGGARGVEVIPEPFNSSETWVSQDPILSRTTYAKVMDGQSIGCSFDPDPCGEFPCSDPNAQCNSTLGWSWKDDSGVPWSQQTRNCSACKEGFYPSGGKCVPPSEACKALKCAAPSTCETDPLLGPYCACPVGYSKDNKTGECQYAPMEAWVASLNSVRRQAASASATNSAGHQKLEAALIAGLEWAPNLAEIAQNWTDYIKSTQCGKEPKVFSKMGSEDYSESDVWVSWTADEASAVDLWAPQPSDASNPRTARITNSSSQYVGCAKSVCAPGAFFTCLFWPKTI